MIAEGGYGCVYYPEMDKDGKKTDNKNYVSKLQLKNMFQTKNEIAIGKILNEVNNGELFFSAVNSASNINIAKINKELANSCDMIKNYKSDQFILLRIKYIGKNNFQEYFLNLKDNKNAFLYLIETYKRLLSGIDILNKKKLVHFDLKDNNIMFSESKIIPIIIDFGLSIRLEIVKKNLDKYFYVYAPDYYYWPLEVHYINYLINIDPNPTKDDIITMAIMYVKNNKVLEDYFSINFRKKYLENCLKVLEKYRKTKDIINKILEKANTWDNYTLSLLYLKYLSFFNPTGFVKNAFTTKFCELLLYNIHPNPEKRKSAEETFKDFQKIFCNKDVNVTSNFIEILENLSKVSIEMKRAIKSDKKELMRLESIIL
jgi:serine/threonine protein kinase